MPPEFEYLYWDSCVFSSYLGSIPGRVAVLDRLLQQIQSSRRIKILSSTYSIAEVAFASGHGQGRFISTEHYNLIDNMRRSPFLELVDVHQSIMYAARDLVRRARLEQNDRLNVVDAIHFATDLWADQYVGRVKIFHTYDDLFHFSTMIGNIPIQEPA